MTRQSRRQATSRLNSLRTYATTITSAEHAWTQKERPGKTCDTGTREHPIGKNDPKHQLSQATRTHSRSGEKVESTDQTGHARNARDHRQFDLAAQISAREKKGSRRGSLEQQTWQHHEAHPPPPWRTTRSRRRLCVNLEQWSRCQAPQPLSSSSSPRTRHRRPRQFSFFFSSVFQRSRTSSLDGREVLPTCTLWNFTSPHFAHSVSPAPICLRSFIFPVFASSRHLLLKRHPLCVD